MSGVIDTTEYVIRTRFETQRDIPGLGDITRRLGGIEQQISGIGGSITRSIGGAFAGLASIQGLVSATRSVIGLHVEVQNAQMGIASLVSALTDTSMTDSLSLSRGLMKGLQEDAAKGAGSFNDYAQGFQSIMAGGLQSGASLAQIRELNRLAMTAGFALRGQEGLKLVGFDVQQAMTAGVGDRTTPIVNQALRSIGVASEKFNKMTAPEKWKTLSSAFGSFEAAAAEMGKTWDAQSSTFLDGLKSLVREGTTSLFASWTDDLVKANEWLAKNHDLLVRMAGVAGGKLSNLYGAARNNPGGVAASGVGLAAAAGGLRGGMAVAGAAGLVSAPAALLAGGIALFAGFIGAAVTAAVTTFGWLREYLAGSFGAFVDSVMGIGTRLARFASSPVMAYIGAGIGVAVGFFMNVLTIFLRGIGTFIDLAFLGASMWVEVVNVMKSALTGDMFGGSRARQRFFDLQAQGVDLLTKQFDDMKILDGLTGDGKPPGFGGVPTQDEAGKLGGVKGGDTIINGDIRVEVKAERLDDPAMVATSFERVLDYLKQNPRGSSAPRMVPRPA